MRLVTSIGRIDVFGVLLVEGQGSYFLELDMGGNGLEVRPYDFSQTFTYVTPRHFGSPSNIHRSPSFKDIGTFVNHYS